MSNQAEPIQAQDPRRFIALDETDIANTARARRWHELNYSPLTNDDDRALEERLSISVRMQDWRRKSLLPPIPPREVATTWRQHLQLLFLMGGYRRRHPLARAS